MDLQDLPIDQVHPNDWNPNAMSVELLNKLMRDIKAMREAGEDILPITVRPHPDRPGEFQIIDGWHRWRVLRKLKCDTISAVVTDVSTTRAKKLTANLNYLRGSYDPTGYVKLLEDLIKDGSSVEELASTMFESEQELHELIALHGSDAVKFEAQKEVDTVLNDKSQATENFVEMKFYIAQKQADIVLRELHRIGQVLKGKNKEGRALELMAVLSSQAPLDAVSDMKNASPPMAIRKKAQAQADA